MLPFKQKLNFLISTDTCCFFGYERRKKEITTLLAQKAYDTTGILSDLSPIAPFMERELLSRLALDAHKKNGLSDVLSLAPFLRGETLNQIATDMLQTGKLTDITPLLPFLDKSIIEEYLNNRRSYFPKET